MISSDLVTGVRWMEERWGAKRISPDWENWEKLLPDFANYTAGAFKETLTMMYRSGRRFAPNSSEVLKELVVVQARRIGRGEDEFVRTCDGDHVWARPLPFDDDRHLTCVLCGEAGGLTTCKHLFNDAGYCVYCPHQVEVAVS